MTIYAVEHEMQTARLYALKADAEAFVIRLCDANEQVRDAYTDYASACDENEETPLDFEDWVLDESNQDTYIIVPYPLH
jgi:hypothetical protein